MLLLGIAVGTVGLPSSMAYFSDRITTSDSFVVSLPQPPPPAVPQACIDVIGHHYTVIYLTAGDDTYPPPGQQKSNGDQVIFGLGGNDHITAGNGKDCLIGGDGDDVLIGGNGKDFIDGGAGTDTCSGGNGKNVIINCEGTGATGNVAAPDAVAVTPEPSPTDEWSKTGPDHATAANTPDAPAPTNTPTGDGAASPSPPPNTVACQPFVLTYTGSTQKDGNTTYSYTLIGGGPAASGCKDVASLALPVCFNPDLAGSGGSVISESHPLLPAGWGYAPQHTEAAALATWSVTGPLVGGGPFDAVFSLTLPGKVIPLTPTVATVSLRGGPSQVAGIVVVPAPGGCTAPTPAASPPSDPRRSGDGHGSFIPGTNATSNQPPARPSPTPGQPAGNADY